MRQSVGSARRASDDSQTILDHSKTQTCSTLVIKEGDRTKEAFQTYRVDGSEGLQPLPNDDGTIVFPIGSVTKLPIAIALHLIIDVYSRSEKPEHARYRGLQERNWELLYVPTLNEYSGGPIMKSLEGDPTLERLLIHFKGLPDVNRHILAPDGTPSKSKEEFIKLAPHLSECAHSGKEEWTEYSNGNYILIGILIEAVSGKSLGQFLKEDVFDQLGMDRTYVTAEMVKGLETSSRAFPYVIDRDRRRKLIEDRPFMSDCVEIGALGIYSCTRDLGRLYSAILPPKQDTPSQGILPKDSFLHLFGFYNPNIPDDRITSKVESKELGDEEWIPAGMITTVGTLRIGSRSINSVVLSKKFQLWAGLKHKEYEVYYQAGSVSTMSCQCYLAASTKSIVIVLSNTLGQGDGADYVARRLLQYCDGQKTLPLPFPHGNVIKESRRGSKAFFDLWRSKWAICESPDDPDLIASQNLVGFYTDDVFFESLDITVDGDKLWMEVVGNQKRCPRVRLARTAKGKLTICPELPTIDWFDAWKHLDLDIHCANDDQPGRVSSLSSKIVLGGKDCKIRYVRQSKA